MDTSVIKEYLVALLRELIRFRIAVVSVFIVVSFSVLLISFFLNKSFSTSALLYADETNIIQPLLKGRAELTKIDRTEVAREMIFTRRQLEAVAKKIGRLSGSEGPARYESVLSSLRRNIEISDENNGYFKITYRHSDPEISFDTLNAVINVFIAETARQKKEESLSAFNFIDAQVKGYKRQLESAEGKLKEFKSNNIEGTEAAVSARIASLNIEIEDEKIAIEELDARAASIKNELENESEYQEAKDKVTALIQRREILQADLDQLRLVYRDSYPDVINLQGQLDELNALIKDMQSDKRVVTSTYSEEVENPLFEDLRKQLSLVEVNRKTLERRIASLKRLLEKEYQRAQKIAGNQADLTELTRDYDVTQGVYEEMLNRKEAARLSMSLDLEGQGVSYKIQEPAAFPISPSGLRFIHLAIIGPILGLLAPLGLLLTYIILDPRLRSAQVMMSQLPEGTILLGVIQHYNTALATRLLRKDMVKMLLVCGVALLIYLALFSVGLVLNV